MISRKLDATVCLILLDSSQLPLSAIFIALILHKELCILSYNQVRDAIPANWKLGDGLDIHYHYVLVLLVDDRATVQIPKWRHVLLSSKEGRKDPSWSPDDLRQYVMFVRTKELFSHLHLSECL